MTEFLNIFNGIWVNGLWGVSITEIIVAISILLLSFLARIFFIRRALAYLAKLTENTESSIDDVVLKSLERPLGYVPIVIGLYVLTVYLPITGDFGEFGSNLVEALVAFTIFSALMNTVSPIFGILSSSTWLTASMSMWLERAVRMILGIICLAIILDIFAKISKIMARQIIPNIILTARSSHIDIDAVSHVLLDKIPKIGLTVFIKALNIVKATKASTKFEPNSPKSPVMGR